ncbi:MAG TPA: VOC family protein [Candidatus Limnocylindrales bacterium]|nr:VOC family protein [Candidatus Limnocylindrales bacterium]
MAEPGYKLDHVACGVRRIAEVAPYLEGVLGARPYRGGPNPDFNGRQWSFANGALLEIIEPAGAEGGFLHRFLDMRGPGIHHVTFKVPDIYAARARAEAAGYTVVGFNDAYPSWKECFLHPKQAQGIVVQFAENHPELSSEDSWHEFAPVVPAPATPALSLLGVRMVTHDLGRSRAQWVELLGAEVVEESAGQLLVRWEGCPLHVRLLLQAAAEQGPQGLETAVPPKFAATLEAFAPLGARLIPV